MKKAYFDKNGELVGTKQTEKITMPAADRGNRYQVEMETVAITGNPSKGQETDLPDEIWNRIKDPKDKLRYGMVKKRGGRVVLDETPGKPKDSTNGTNIPN